MSVQASPIDPKIPITFSAFVVTLVQSAMVHLGEAPNPETGGKNMDLSMARHTIDVLTMLKQKTNGNRSDDETKLLDTLLYEVRTKFLTASGSYQRR
jgi:hypothetical protein